MSDSSSRQPPSPDPSKPEGFDAASERELDAALDQAASMAAELSVELGSAAREAQRPLSELMDDPQKDLDNQLAELDQLVETTATEVTSSPAAPVPESVPDFMAEFMDPAPAAAPAASASSIGDDLMVSPNVPMVSRRATTSAAPTVKPSKTEMAPADAPSRAAEPAAIRALAAALSPVVTALEVADRPFRRVGERIRRIAGWAAVGILVVSAVVFALSRG